MKNYLTKLVFCLLLFVPVAVSGQIQKPINPSPANHSTIYTDNQILLRWENPPFINMGTVSISDDPTFPAPRTLSAPLTFDTSYVCENQTTYFQDFEIFNLLDMFDAPLTGKTFYWRVDVICCWQSRNSQQWDFEIQPGRITGKKFEDTDGDGVWDNDESVLQGWTINLSDGESIVQTDVTDEYGNYLFNVTEGGVYTISEVQQQGWRQTYPQSGTHTVEIEPGQTITGKNFGNEPLQASTINGAKFQDNDGDGVWDDDEPGLQGWVINLSDGQFAITNSNGNYTFLVEVPGTYTITESQQDGWEQTFPDSSHTIEVDYGETIEDMNFGNRPLGPSIIMGSKFQDKDGDGVWDQNEPGLEGWTINLSDGQSATTDQDGNFTFLVSEPGTYTLSEAQQTGWIQTCPTDTTYEIQVELEEIYEGKVFGNKVDSCTIEGVKFRDNNGNGELDEDEFGLSGWTINLSDGQSTVTDEFGHYSFTTMVGTYDINEVVKNGWTQTCPEGGEGYKNVTVNSVQDNIFNFGNKPDSCTIIGKKFRDNNGNGEWDDGEPGLAGWTFNLSDGQSTVTDTDGNFSFRVLPGIFDMNEELKTGWTQTCPADGEGYKGIVVSLTSPLDLFLFGNKPNDGGITGKKFNDKNGNGQLDDGELGLPGWTIKLNNGDSTITDTNGNYIFTVEPGIYEASEVQKPGWIQTYPDSGSHSVTVNPGVILEGINFGNTQPGSIYGKKYFDLDNNKKHDPGEPGLNGVIIELYQNNVLVQTDTTDFVDNDGDGFPEPVSEFGLFQFDDLAPGSYEVKEITPKGFFLTEPAPSYNITIPSEEFDTLLFGNATNLGMDFGDLPDPYDSTKPCAWGQCYPTKLPIGAFHLDQGPMLGYNVDTEADGQPDFFALGDDSLKVDDEDGVKFLTFKPDETGEVEITVSGAPGDFPCYVSGWIDFNADRLLAIGEVILYRKIEKAGTYTFSFMVPADFKGEGYSRFRVSTNSLSVIFPCGPAPDGEVEDYVAVGFDFGDAPELLDSERPEFPFGYPTRHIHNGAMHIATPLIKLGELTDAEFDGQPNCFACGDDNNDKFDEDGISFGSGFTKVEDEPDPANPNEVFTYYGINKNSEVTLTPLASRIGVFNAWFDFNRDGDWEDPFEHVLIDEEVKPAPDYTQFTFNIPEDVQLGFTYARFRFSTQQNLSFTGPAFNGEIEDYLIKIDSVMIVSIDDEFNNRVPTEYKLNQNYPNPFNPTTMITYQLPFDSHVLIKVYNILGKEIALLVNDKKTAGYYQLEWSAEKLPSGVYFYTILARAESVNKEYRSVKKMLVIK